MRWGLPSLTHTLLLSLSMLLVYLSIIRSQYRANGRTTGDHRYRHASLAAILSVCPLSVSLSHFVALISMIFDSQMYKSLSFILLSGLFHLYWLEMCDYDILRWCFNTICCPIIILSFKLNLTWWTSFVCRVLYFIACVCLSCRFHRLSGQPASHRSGPAWSCDL